VIPETVWSGEKLPEANTDIAKNKNIGSVALTVPETTPNFLFTKEIQWIIFVS